MKIALLVSMTAACLLATSSQAQDSASLSLKGKNTRPVEVGTVNWDRDLDAAYTSSRSSGKPVLVLFQEVPGCAGCQKFGREVLSQPLLVEAIEDLFEPVVVYNNKGGKDAQILAQFKEPAWNYQVIRFLNANGQDIVPRKDKIWSTAGVATRMIEALKAADRPVPKYLTTLAPITDSDNRAFAAFSMHCFWTGEYQLGKINGVVGTEAGWLKGREVTLVQFDKSKLSLENLAREAAKVKCADSVFTRDGKSIAGLPGGKLDKSYRVADSKDQKRQIKNWNAIKNVPALSLMQLTKINALAPDNMAAATAWLSPRQQKQLAMPANARR